MPQPFARASWSMRVSCWTYSRGDGTVAGNMDGDTLIEGMASPKPSPERYSG